MTDIQWLGFVIALSLVLVLTIYCSHLHKVTHDQLNVIEDLVYENINLKQINTGLRADLDGSTATIGSLTDRLQISEMKQWGDDATQAPPTTKP